MTYDNVTAVVKLNQKTTTATACLCEAGDKPIGLSPGISGILQLNAHTELEFLLIPL